ncbi:hypothetical protein [Actinomadura gamaensis]|uniref:Uncharacterized protein n=1 Tax=Actinomadura gamaensis TaxID=1763541 RepID=A0ABV9U1Z3_9ACTN
MPRGTYLHLEDGTEERFQCAPGPGGWRYVASRTDGTRIDLVVDARWRQIRVEIVAPDWWLRGGVTGREVAWVRASSSGEASEHSAPASGFLGESPAFLIAAAHHVTRGRLTSEAAFDPDADRSELSDALTPVHSEGAHAPTGAQTVAGQNPPTVGGQGVQADSSHDVPASAGQGDPEPAGRSVPTRGDVESSGTGQGFAGVRGPGHGTAVDVRLVRVSGVVLATLTEAWRWRLASVTRHETETGPLPVGQYEVADLATGEIQHVHMAGDVVLDAPGIELVELDGPPNFLVD